MELVQLGMNFGQRHQELTAKVDKTTSLVEQLMKRMDIANLPSRPTCTFANHPPPSTHTCICT